MATVLLAEDDTDIRFLVTFKLKQAGYQVRAFGDGLSAVADAREHPPDLAILDVMMPGLTGPEVCQELRKDPATAKIPIIMLTAMAQESDIAAGLAAGADEYIVKPFSPREFAARVDAVLARSQASVPAQRDLAQRDLAQRDLAQRDLAQRDLAQPGPASAAEGSAAPPAPRQPVPRQPTVGTTPQRPAATGD